LRRGESCVTHPQTAAPTPIVWSSCSARRRRQP